MSTDLQSDEITDKLNPMQPDKIVGATNDDVLEYTRRARLGLAQDLTKTGAPEGRGVRQLMDLLNDLDNQSLASKRLDLDTESANNDNEVALMTVRVQERMEKANREALERGMVPATMQRGMPVPDTTNLPKVEAIEGEFSCEVVEDTYDDFMARMEAKEEGKS